MRPFRKTIPFDEALAIIRGAALPIERTERVHVLDANGRVAAQAIVASADVPPFARAAMDGYAVVAEDTSGASTREPRVLRCVERIYTGRMPSRPIGRGECMEIATGAPLPAGATAVVMIEETRNDTAGHVGIVTGVSPGQNVSPRGADLRSGATVLERGRFVNPSRVGALAAAGVCDIDVYARPVVGIVSTGDELIEPGRPLGPAQIYDINRYTLSAVVTNHGGTPEVLASTADSIEDITAALEGAAGADIIVFSGGSSVGEKDLIIDVLRAAGEVLFHGIAVKPGKPTIFGRVGGKPVFGMPGNPTSCLSNAYLLLVPLLRAAARLPPYQPQRVTVPIARRIVSATDRHQFYTVKIVEGAAVPAFKASGDITSMSEADGYFEIPADTNVIEAGDLVEVRLF